jgi:hypothetical protein
LQPDFGLEISAVKFLIFAYISDTHWIRQQMSAKVVKSPRRTTSDEFGPVVWSPALNPNWHWHSAGYAMASKAIGQIQQVTCVDKDKKGSGRFFKSEVFCR